MKFFINKSKTLLILILLIGFIVRFYGFDNPIADWHSWRQSETASVSRNFVQHGFDILHPRMDNISNVQSGYDNPEGYFMVEFPIYNTLQAGLYSLFGFFTIEQWGRLVSMTASVFAGLFLYLIVSRRSTPLIGIFATFFYMFIPFNIYYGRTILPDTSMTMAFLGAIYFFDRFVSIPSKKTVVKATKKEKHLHTYQFGSAQKDQTIFYLLSLFFTMLALLLKPQSVFFLIPMLYLVFATYGWRAFFQWHLYLFAIVSLAPVLAWRHWISQYPEGIPANQWLFNGNGIRFRPAWFRWIFFERLTVLISGYAGVILLAVGFFKIRNFKNWLYFASFFVSTLLFVSIVATGNVQHDYYQIPAMPSVAILMALGSYILWNWKIKQYEVGKILLMIVVVVSFYNSWNIVKEYFNINNRSIIAAGEAVQRITTEDSLIVANYNGDSSLLYQLDRKGWASFQDPMDVLIKKGADYLVLINPSEGEVAQWEEQYTRIESTDQYAIFLLHQ